MLDRFKISRNPIACSTVVAHRRNLKRKTPAQPEGTPRGLGGPAATWVLVQSIHVCHVSALLLLSDSAVTSGSVLS